MHGHTVVSILVYNRISQYKNVTHCMHAYQWQQHGRSWCGGVGPVHGPGPVVKMKKGSLKRYIYLITLVSVQYGRILHECGDVFSQVRRTSENTPRTSAISRIVRKLV